MCLAWLEDLVKPGDHVFDFGCGSAILSIAAALLGAELEEVRAVARAVAQQERRTLGRAVVRRAGISQAVVVERRRVRRSVMA
jgi:precorrin-6B methylase 2